MKKTRLSQHGSLLVAITSAQGLLAPYALAAPASETISTAVSNGRAYSTTWDSLYITDQGSLTATSSSPALQISTAGNLGTLDNDGTLFGTNSYGLFNTGTIGTLDNAGVITGDSGFGAVFLTNTSRVDTLMNSGTIGNQGFATTMSFGVYNGGALTTLTNTDSGVLNARIALYNSGVIDRVDNAGTFTNANNSGSGMGTIYNVGTINTLVNTGKIDATDASNPLTGTVAIRNQGKIGTLTNTGSITSQKYGILSDSPQSTIGELFNSGTIRAPQAIMLNNSTPDTPLSITNTGTIAGNITSFNNQPLVISGGSGQIGRLTGYTGAKGIIQTNGSDIIFRSGALILNDDMRTSGGSVVADSAVLLVDDVLNIDGNYQQNAGAALVLGVGDYASAAGDTSNDSGYGRLVVTGSANVDKGSSIYLTRAGRSYQFAAGQRYVAIDAASANTHYNASSLTYKVTGYNGNVTGKQYDDGTRSALVLSLADDTAVAEPVKTTTPDMAIPAVPGKATAPVTPTAPVKIQRGWATTPGATAALGGLGHYSGISPQLLELYNASLAIDNKEEANRAGESLSTSQNINASTANTTAISKAMTVVGTHMNSVRNPQTAGISGVATGDDYSNNWIVWGQPFGGLAQQDSTERNSGYKAKFAGLLLGADRALGDNWRAGAALNFSNTSVHGKDNLSGNSSRADNYGIIGYAGYTGNPWYLNLSAGLNRQNYESSRQADFTGFAGRANGKFNGQSVTLQSEVGYPLTLPADVVLTPLASLTYGYQHIEGYQETGGNGMALDIKSAHNQSVQSEIGTRIEKTIATRVGNLTPFAQISWIHQYDNRPMSSTATYVADTIGETQFTTKGASPVKDMAGIAIGSTLYDANNLSLDARYDLQAGERYQAHTFSLRLRKTF